MEEVVAALTRHQFWRLTLPFLLAFELREDAFNLGKAGKLVAIAMCHKHGALKSCTFPQHGSGLEHGISQEPCKWICRDELRRKLMPICHTTCHVSGQPHFFILSNWQGCIEAAV